LIEQPVEGGLLVFRCFRPPTSNEAPPQTDKMYRGASGIVDNPKR
jgi:hypothetical protein